MTTDWLEREVGEIAAIVGGSTPSTADPTNFDGDVPWLTPKDLSGSPERFVARGARNISSKGLAACSAKLVPKGAVLLTTRAPIGYVAIAKTAIATNQGFRSLVLNDKADNGFIYYWLRANKDELERYATGSTFRELTGSALKRIKLRLPPLHEQQQISSILGALDDKIELNRRMSDTLDAIARALFRSRFVDSNRASEGRTTVRLGDVAEFIKGRSYTSEQLAPSHTALITLKSFARGGGYRPEGLKSYTGPYKDEQIVKAGEIVIACTDVTQAAEVIGRPAVVRPSAQFQTLVASLDTMVVRPKRADVSRAFLYFLARTPSFTEHTYAYTTGTTVLHLSKEALPSFEFVLPDASAREAFDAVASPVLSRIENLEAESVTLAALRDALLSKLISGELRIGDVERVVEATT